MIPLLIIALLVIAGVIEVHPVILAASILAGWVVIVAAIDAQFEE